MQNSSQPFVGIDVGTTSVRCVVGQLHGEEETATIVGVGEAVSEGMRKGNVADSQAVANSIVAAVNQAEQTAGIKINGATVSINGSHVMGMTSKGIIAVSSSDTEITEEEVKRAEEAATIVQLPQNREIIHVFSRSFGLDGQENVKDPVGMKGVRLEVDTHVITASTPSLRNVYASFEQAGVLVNDRLISGVADSNSVLTKTQRESGVALVDIGSATTNVAIHEDGDIQHVAVIPVGGMSITNDLAIGLRTEIEVAEKLKLKLGGKDDDGKTKSLKVKIGKEEHTFKREDIIEIISARVEELFELIDHELAAVGRSGKLPGGIVFVGGGSNLYGLVENAKETLSLPARIVTPSGFSGITDKIGRPEFACVIGLMLHDMQVYGGSDGFSTGRKLPKMRKNRAKKSGDGAGVKAKGFLSKFKPVVSFSKLSSSPMLTTNNRGEKHLMNTIFVH